MYRERLARGRLWRSDQNHECEPVPLRVGYLAFRRDVDGSPTTNFDRPLRQRISHKTLDYSIKFLFSTGSLSLRLIPSLSFQRFPSLSPKVTTSYPLQATLFLYIAASPRSNLISWQALGSGPKNISFIEQSAQKSRPISPNQSLSSNQQS